MKYKFLIPVILLFLNYACVNNLPKRQIDRKPTYRELVGFWEITSSSIQSVEKWQEKYPDWDNGFPYESFFLKEDSSVLMPLKPNKLFWRENFSKQSLEDTLKGVWSIKKEPVIYGDDDSTYIVSIRLDYYENSKRTHMEFLDLIIAEENGELILWTFLGDPDQVIYQDYKKK
ncbi:MAG: hypothetical protein R2799_07420 [Crocinitomicaceae bacterium]